MGLHHRRRRQGRLQAVRRVEAGDDPERPERLPAFLVVVWKSPEPVLDLRGGREPLNKAPLAVGERVPHPPSSCRLLVGNRTCHSAGGWRVTPSTCPRRAEKGYGRTVLSRRHGATDVVRGQALLLPDRPRGRPAPPAGDGEDRREPREEGPGRRRLDPAP